MPGATAPTPGTTKETGKLPPPVVEVPKLIAEKEARLRDNLALAQAVDEAVDNDKAALRALIVFYDEQSQNTRLAAGIRRQFAVSSAQAAQQIRAIDEQISQQRQTDADAATQRAQENARRAESDRQALLRANLRVAQATEETLKDDIRAQSKIVVDLKRQIRVAKDGSAAERVLRAELRIEKGNLRDLREREQERQDDLRLDAIRDQQKLASFTKGIRDDERALRAEERYWLKKVASEKRGSIARRKYRIELERTRKDLRDLREQQDETSDASKGTTIVELLTQNAQSFARFGSNIGQAGIDPLSGFDWNASLAAMLARQNVGDPAASIRRPRDEMFTEFSGGVDRLVAALDRNTRSRGGNDAVGETGDGSKSGTINVRSVEGGARYQRFWDAQRARRIAEESTSG